MRKSNLRLKLGALQIAMLRQYLHQFKRLLRTDERVRRNTAVWIAEQHLKYKRSDLAEVVEMDGEMRAKCIVARAMLKDPELLEWSLEYWLVFLNKRAQE